MLTRISYLVIAAIVAVAAAAICVVLDTDDATTHPPATLEQRPRDAASIQSVRSRSFEATLAEGVRIEDVLHLANVTTGEGGVRVITR